MTKGEALLRSRTAMVALAIVALAVAVRMAGVVATLDYEPIFDPASFDRYARSLADGRGYPESTLAPGEPTAYRPPGYPVVLAGIYRTTPGSVTPARLVQALFGGATVALVGVLGAALLGRRAALVAMALAAVFPPLVTVDMALLSESLFVPLVLAAVAATLAARSSGRPLRWAAVTGGIVGLAVLTRSNGAVLLLPLGVGLLGVGSARRLSALAAPAVMVAAALAVMAPWVVRNAVALDAFVPLSTQLGYTLAGTYNDESRTAAASPGRWIDPHRLPEYRDLLAARGRGEAELDRALRDRALDYVQEHPGYVARVTVLNAGRLANLEPDYTRASVRATGLDEDLAGLVQWSSPPVLLLALAGAVLAVRRRAGPAFVWLVPVLLLLSSLPLTSPVRTRAPADPFLLLLAAAALVRLRGYWAGRVAGKR